VTANVQDCGPLLSINGQHPTYQTRGS
jgi:hypothetical protein